MKKYSSRASFYASDDWDACKAQVLKARIRRGGVYCEHCGNVILKSFDGSAKNNAGAIVFHHIKELTELNVNDASISINPANIAIVHWQCHNVIHKRFCGQNTVPEKKVYLITGAACSGKTTFARERMSEGDVIIDVDDIWQQVTGLPRYTKPNSVKRLVFAARDVQEELVASGAGTWRNAFIIKGIEAATAKDRRELAERFGAEVIVMDTPKEVCLQRLRDNPQGRDVAEYSKYIEKYFKYFN